MAFDEDMKMAFEEEEQHYLFSRLSVCSNFDADGELSDSGEKRSKKLEFSDSDQESAGIHSLPATPPRRRRRKFFPVSAPNSPFSGDKAYASENEKKQGSDDNNKNNRRRRKMRSEYPPWVSSMRQSYVEGGDGGGGYGGGGVVVVTRPIGGGRPLCMDLGEVKACKDLGFELEPGRVSYSGGSTNMDTTTNSGGNSPGNSSHRRISSPGDDPKEVKARLKAWAQAVAFVSTTHKAIAKK